MRHAFASEWIKLRRKRLLIGTYLALANDAILYAVVALTIVRIVPVMLALHGTDIGRRDALFLGWMGPRGLASLVFGLLAVIGLDGSASDLAGEVMVTTVLLSVILHGASARPIAAAFARADHRAAAAAEESARREAGPPAPLIGQG